MIGGIIHFANHHSYNEMVVNSTGSSSMLWWVVDSGGGGGAYMPIHGVHLFSEGDAFFFLCRNATSSPSSSLLSPSLSRSLLLVYVCFLFLCFVHPSLGNRSTLPTTEVTERLMLSWSSQKERWWNREGTEGVALCFFWHD
jgi:hypothetical protein